MSQDRSVRFGSSFVRPVDVVFDGEAQSSDGGLVLLGAQAERVYSGVYCARGDVENRIKELNLGLALGRTSCSRAGPMRCCTRSSSASCS